MFDAWRFFRRRRYFNRLRHDSRGAEIHGVTAGAGKAETRGQALRRHAPIEDTLTPLTLLRRNGTTYTPLPPLKNDFLELSLIFIL